MKYLEFNEKGELCVTKEFQRQIDKSYTDSKGIFHDNEGNMYIKVFEMKKKLVPVFKLIKLEEEGLS